MNRGKFVFVFKEAFNYFQENRQYRKTSIPPEAAPCYTPPDFSRHVTLSREILFQVGGSHAQVRLALEHGSYNNMV